MSKYSPTLVRVPPLFLAVYFCFVVKIFTVRARISLQSIQPSCIHIDLLPRVYQLTDRRAYTNLGSVGYICGRSISPGIEATEHQSSSLGGAFTRPSRKGNANNLGTPPTRSLPCPWFSIGKVINTPSNVREFVHRVKQSIICSHNMAAPSTG